MARWFRRWWVPGQGEVQADQGLLADMEADSDALDRGEEQAFEQLGADPNDTAGLARGPVPRHGDPSDAVAADHDAIDREVDHLGNELGGDRP